VRTAGAYQPVKNRNSAMPAIGRCDHRVELPSDLKGSKVQGPELLDFEGFCGCFHAGCRDFGGDSGSVRWHTISNKIARNY
jgi:hypothetical protein